MYAGEEYQKLGQGWDLAELFYRVEEHVVLTIRAKGNVGDDGELCVRYTDSNCTFEMSNNARAWVGDNYPTQKGCRAGDDANFSYLARNQTRNAFFYDMTGQQRIWVFRRSNSNGPASLSLVTGRQTVVLNTWVWGGMEPWEEAFRSVSEIANLLKLCTQAVSRGKGIITQLGLVRTATDWCRPFLWLLNATKPLRCTLWRPPFSYGDKRHRTILLQAWCLEIRAIVCERFSWVVLSSKKKLILAWENDSTLLVTQFFWHSSRILYDRMCTYVFCIVVVHRTTKLKPFSERFSLVGYSSSSRLLS